MQAELGPAHYIMLTFTNKTPMASATAPVTNVPHLHKNRISIGPPPTTPAVAALFATSIIVDSVDAMVSRMISLAAVDDGDGEWMWIGSRYR